MADIKEILVAWHAGERISTIAQRFGYTRPTVRKYVRAAERAGLRVGDGRHSEAEWAAVTEAAITGVTVQRVPGAVATVRLSVLHQRLQREQGLQASWGSFYRYVAAQWPGRLARTPRPTVRLAWRRTRSSAWCATPMLRIWPRKVKQAVGAVWGMLHKLSRLQTNSAGVLGEKVPCTISRCSLVGAMQACMVRRLHIRQLADVHSRG